MASTIHMGNPAFLSEQGVARGIVKLVIGASLGLALVVVPPNIPELRQEAGEGNRLVYPYMLSAVRELVELG